MSDPLYQRGWRAANPEKLRGYKKKSSVPRVAFLTRWKLAAGCIDCGYKAHPAALDFDHVRGEKRFGLGGTQIRSWKVILAELAKCVVRCANCHRVVTQKRRAA